MTTTTRLTHHAPAARTPASARTTSVAAALTAQLSRLYVLAERSTQVFASPLGPFDLRGAVHHLPRFVYFGAEPSADATRLALYAGFDGSDAPGARSLAQFVERVAGTPEPGRGLNLSFFPLVNPSGFALNTTRNHNATDLLREDWGSSVEPEIALLRHDARGRDYHGFIRVETWSGGEITGVIRLVRSAAEANDSALFVPNAHAEFPVRWFRAADREGTSHGPLSLADDFATQPFELVLRFPRALDDERLRQAVDATLERFMAHYRAITTYGLNL